MRPSPASILTSIIATLALSGAAEAADIVGATLEPAVRYNRADTFVYGDTWTTTWTPWGSDGDLYSVACDTYGFEDVLRSTGGRNVCINTFDATRSPLLTGRVINSFGDAMSMFGPNNGGGSDGATYKGTGFACIDGVLYLSVARQGYAVANHLSVEVKDATLLKSTDRGLTWSAQPTARAQPMSPITFPGNRFACPFFIDYGRDGQATVDGASTWVYALSNTTSAWNNGDAVLIGRVRRVDLPNLDASQWRFYRGGDGLAAASWGTLAEATPVITAAGRCSTAGVTYNAPLQRYIMPQWHYPDVVTDFSNVTRSRLEFYQSPTPWGPWSLFASMDSQPQGLYNASIPSKFISSDGRSLWLLAAGNFNTWGAPRDTTLYSINQVRMTLQVAGSGTPPAISGITVPAITATTAAVAWSTDRAATSQVDYGTTTGYGSSTTPDATTRTSHRLTLGELRPSTLYHYRVRSIDAAGNVALSGDATFTTPATPADPPNLVNHLVNPGFELDGAAVQTPRNWSTWAAAGSEVADATTNAGARGGAWSLAHRLNAPYQVYTYQGVTGLANGPYRLTAWVRGSGGQSVARLEAKDFGGSTRSATIPATATFTRIDVGTVNVVNGSCTVGIYSIAAAGQWVEVDDVSLTSAVTDATPPQISAIAAASITTSGATITWTTNEASDTQVEYGPTTAYGSATARVAAPVTAHSQVLSGLAAGTLYHYRVISRDAAGNIAISADATFATTAAPSSNRLTNPGFEADGAAVQTISGWSTWDGSAGTHADADATVHTSAHSGSFSCRHAKSAPYEVYTYQVLTGLANGPYRLSAWVRSSGGQAYAFLEAKDFGGPGRITPIPAAAAWTLIDAGTVDVANGMCVVGVYSYAAAGQWLEIDDVAFTPSTTADTTPPTISGLAATAITPSGATISWTTNEASDTQVEYGTTASYGTSTPLAGAAVTAHSQTLSGLSPATTYHVRVKSRDVAGNLAVSAGTTFTTAPAPVVNRVANPGFEADGADVQVISGWTTWPGAAGVDADADFTSHASNPHGGTFQLTHWKGAPYEVYTYQVLTGLANGSYRLTAWVRSSGGQTYAWLEAKDFGGAKRTADIPASATWMQVDVGTVQVSNGMCVIGVYSKAGAGQWVDIDDVSFLPATASAASSEIGGESVAGQSGCGMGAGVALLALALALTTARRRERRWE